MENYQVKISRNVQKQTFVKGLKSSKIVNEALTFGLKEKRKHLDRKLHGSIQKKKFGRQFNLEKKRDKWTEFRVMFQQYFYLIVHKS